ncbi:Disease resistance protein [Citrus sinensis]|uniref:Disease resistance protein n=1 Tax=Citrus sinensis TaxID=2711 RepID=A0ACB8KF67_CITSI|nr:Disease resistance protein [Citrus sinensis]
MAVEFCQGVFSSIISEGTKALFEPIMRQISYVFKYQSYIEELKDQVKELGGINEMVQQHVYHATRQGEEIYQRVKDWRSRVESTEGVAKSIIDEEDGAKKSCFKGLCPNLLSRYKLSKRAAKAAKDAANLMEKGDKLKSDVSYDPPPESESPRGGKDNEAFDSRKKVLQDVMEALKDDKLNIIGVYGMGGVGKTTLVRQVRKQVMEDKLFDKVVMAELTHESDNQQIQNKLASDLGIKFELNENIFDRANRLRRVLKKEKRVLIILDNIWTRLELDAVGIPSGDVAEKDRKDDQRRCTIILTSRKQDLLSIDMNSQKNFPIDALPRKEALQLFEKIVGDSTKISAFQSIANEIVERCGGLPVALSTVANALKTKERYFWQDALNQLRRSDAREIHGMQANVYTSIKLSYEFLESEEAKSLFRLCGLYSEGNVIPVSDLLRHGVGWGLFENVYTLEEARSRVHRLIDNLKSSCLLLDGDAKDEVKMHDVIHVVAVSIAAEKRMFNIPNVADVEKKMEETIQKGPIAISLPYRDIQELPERLGCPNLQLFLLYTEGNGPMQVSDLFFEGTEELKVLDFTGIHFSSLLSSLGRLINLQTLCLDWCQQEDVAAIGQLKKLEILSFRYSDIKQLPLEIGQLTRLQLLDLSNCRSLVVIAPNVISKFSRLEELYMGDSFSQWDKVEGGSNASLAELKGLSKLTTLEIHVRDAEILPQDLVSVELQRYKIFGRVHCTVFPLLESLSLSYLNNLETICDSQLTEDQSFSNLRIIEVEACHKLKHLFSFSMAKNLLRLQKVEVALCGDLEMIFGPDREKPTTSLGFNEIIADDDTAPKVILPRLEELNLRDLRNMKKLWADHNQGMYCCQNLTKLYVSSCHRMKYLFSYSMVNSLLQLQHLEIRSCESMEGVVDTTGWSEREEGKLIELKVFPKLHSLKLHFLPELTSFANTGHIHSDLVVEFPSLLNLEISWCNRPDREKPTTSLGFNEIIADDDTAPKVILPSLEELNLWDLRNMKKLWADHNQGMYCCQNLTKLYVGNCNRLMQLQHLEIRLCDSMEGVVDTTGWSERDEGKLIELKVFPKLHSLQLEALYELTSFANTGHIHSDLVVEFPSLLKLEIQSCSNMLRFISTSSPEDTIHSEMQPPPLFDEKVGIPSSLVNLKVSDCKELEEIVGHVGEEAKENRIAFSELKVLILDDLRRLTSFCLENYTLEFPSLERVSMIRCPNMKTFSQGILSIPKPCKVQVTEKEGGELHHWEGNKLNSTIQKCYEEMIGFRDMEFLQFSHFPRLKEISHGQALPVSFFNNLRHLVVDDCTNMSSAIPANLLRCLNNLEWLEVRNCDSLEEVLHLEVLNADKEHIGPLFPKLFELRLIDLPKLKRFCNFTGNIIEMLELENLTIENCPDMETFISNSLVHVTTDNKKPQKLTSEENFLLAHQVQPLFDEKVAFPQLMKLKLSGLHKVQHLWKENAKSNKVFANLKSPEIFECSKLQKLVPASWHLENLATLEVSKCHGLINLLTLSTSESLVTLQRMKIADCKMIEQIIQLQVGEEAKGCVVFEELEYLGLDCLPSLTSFCSGNYALEFPSLKPVVVRQCPKMKIFSQGVLDTPMLNKVNVTEEEKDDDEEDDDEEDDDDDEDDDDEGCWEGNLNDTIKKLFNEMVSIN